MNFKLTILVLIGSLLVQYSLAVEKLYLGCFQDYYDDRDLSYLSENELQTIEKCVSYCAQRGYSHAGLQEGYYCNCGNNYGKHGKLDDSECDNSCSGDTNEICGGQSKNSVYETGVVTKSCYSDNKESRDLGYRHDDDSLTIESCVSHCNNLGYPYAGLQSGSHCHCGNFYGRYGHREDTACDNNCQGDVTENCGGHERNNFTYSSRYLGCFEDRDEDRDMYDYNLIEGLTVEKCLAVCQEHGFRFAGLQKGNECFCDDFYGRFSRKTNRECDYNCEGNANQLCGGYWRNSVYRV